MFNRTKSKKGRRSPMATVSLIVVGLMTTGGAYALFSSTANADDSTNTVAASSQSQVNEGEKLFASNCATCHGLSAQGTSEGPSLIGVGAASVDFQVGTGRMPMAAQGPQAEEKPAQFTDEQVDALAQYVASLGPGPSVPSTELTNGEDGDAAEGAELFRINCAMCHNAAAAGGALTRGKYAPSLQGVEEKHIYEAMETGPQNMPVFSDSNIKPEDKRDIIAYLKTIENQGSPGGLALGSLGPVSEGLFIWTAGLALIIGFMVWLTSRSS